MIEPKIRAYLNIEGDEFDIDSLSQKLQIRPTDFYIKGDAIHKSGSNQLSRLQRFRTSTCWMFSTPEIETYYLEEVTSLLCSNFIGKEKDIQNFLIENKLVASLILVVICTPTKVPALILDQMILEFSNSIGVVRVEFDTYINPD